MMFRSSISVTFAILLASILIGHIVVAAVDTTTTTTLENRELIIGGEKVDRSNDFPFYVSFENENRSLTCGGALIAPDMIITATHCNPLIQTAYVGRYNKKEEENDIGYEIIERIHHPRYDNSTFYYDYMLVKFNSTILSNDDIIIPLNNDPTIPAIGLDTKVTVVGLGRTIYDDPRSKPEVLQKTTLGILSNDECSQATDPNHPLIINYHDRITPDMMCTKGNNTDTCTGDSGGPLFIEKDSGDKVLVGLVSWGYYCNVMPGVNVRISYQYEWLRTNICHYSSSPPEYLKCEELSTETTTESSVVVVVDVPPPPPPTNFKDLANQDTDDDAETPTHIDVTIAIQSDRYPQDTSWRLVQKNDRNNKTIAGVSQGRYRIVNHRYHHEIRGLELSTTYQVILHDANKDGICCDYGTDGYIEVYTKPAHGYSHDDRDAWNILLHANGTFDSIGMYEFTTPATVPAVSNNNNNDRVSSSSSSATPDTYEFTIGRVLNVTIHTDSYPHEIGWRVARMGKKRETIQEMRPGRYIRENYTYMENVFLKDDAVYVFEIYDDYGDGFCCKHGNGKFSLNVQDNALLSSDDGYKNKEDTTIRRIGEFTSMTTQLFASAKNPPPIDDGQQDSQKEPHLTLHIDTNSDKSKIGWILERRAGPMAVSRILGDQDVEVIGYHLPGEGDPLEAIEKTLPIRQGGLYAFTLLEPDGPCCSLSVGTYTVWLGERDVGELILEGDIRDWWFPQMFDVDIPYDGNSNNNHHHDEDQQNTHHPYQGGDKDDNSSSTSDNNDDPYDASAAWSLLGMQHTCFMLMAVSFVFTFLT